MKKGDEVKEMAYKRGKLQEKEGTHEKWEIERRRGKLKLRIGE